MQRMVWGMACVGTGLLLTLASCGGSGGGNDIDGPPPDAADAGDRPAMLVLDGGKDTFPGPMVDSAASSATDTSAATSMFTCAPAGGARLLAAPPRDQDGRVQTWDPWMRIVRIGPRVARVVARLKGADTTDVYSFDPTDSAGAIVNAPIRVNHVLQIERSGSAIDVYGIRTDSASAQAQLVLVSIDDATAGLTEMALTPPGGIAVPRRGVFEPPMGRFLRFGPKDVYFTYTEEIGLPTNPTYRLSVGRVTPSSGPVMMNVLETAPAGRFLGITAAALAHVGSTVFLFTGASGRSETSPTGADELTVPDDGSIPASTSRRTIDREEQLVALGSELSGVHHLAFMDVPTIFQSPSPLWCFDVDAASLGMFKLPDIVLHVRSDATKPFGSDAHFEGSQLLMFGPDRAFWLDATARMLRASSFEPPSPLPPGYFTKLQVAAITFGKPPTADSSTFDVAFAQFDMVGDEPLYYGAVACTR